MIENMTIISLLSKQPVDENNDHSVDCTPLLVGIKNNHFIYFNGTYCVIPYGLVVRIPGFHPGGPGSIPGMGSNLFY